MTDHGLIKPWMGTIILHSQENNSSLEVSSKLFEELDRRGLWRTLYEECNLLLSMESVMRVRPELCREMARIASSRKSPYSEDPVPEVFAFEQAFAALAQKAYDLHEPLLFQPDPDSGE